MEQGQWNVVALQLDLLDNRPAVSMRNAISGEMVTINPLRVLDVEFSVSKHAAYASGYLQGYADRHIDVAIGGGISQLAQQLRISGCER